MLGNYFYNQIIRKTVIAFGTLFNDIHVQHDDSAGNVISDIKVPIAYGPRQKFLARITQQAELNKATQITLPRMSFEITNISYDSTRKAGITQTFKAQDKNKCLTLICTKWVSFCKINDVICLKFKLIIITIIIVYITIVILTNII